MTNKQVKKEDSIRRMKIFTDRDYLLRNQGYVEMLYPFWGKVSEDPQDPNSGRFDRYTGMGRRFFEMAPLSEADIIVFPGKWEYTVGDQGAMKLAWQLAEITSKARKPLVIFFWSDSDESMPIKGSVIFRTSLYRSQKKPNEFAMSSWCVDFVDRYLNGKLSIRQKPIKPRVGFCGYARPLKVPFRRKLKNALSQGASFLGLKERQGTLSKLGAVIRSEAIRILSTSPLVETNFIVRDRFLGGAILPDGGKDLISMQKIRLEYVENMVESDYILCARGGGNFSYRLYETLCCGRIPVFIDTDCVLPYDFAVEWKKYCVWVDECELPQIAEKVAEFNDGLSPQDFVDLQYECRRFWKNYLSPEGFFQNFYRHFQ